MSGPAFRARAQLDSPQIVTIASLAAQSGRYFGAAVRMEYLRRDLDRDLRDAVEAECSLLTPEIDLKWDVIEQERGHLTLTQMDDLVSFAQSSGKKVHGHTLLWHLSVPSWAEAELADRKDWTLVRNHLAAVIPRYAGIIEDWDVVNEPIETGHRQDGLRPSIFLRAFGPTYINRALEEANRLAPSARLMINEYGLDYNIPVENDRRYLFLKLLERLRYDGAPLHSIGIQAHLDLAKAPFSQKVFEKFLKDIADMGFAIVITELDVKEHVYTLSPEERDQRVGEIVTDYLDVALAQPAVEGVITWGLSDRRSWLYVTPEDYVRHAGAWKAGEGPGLNRGLPLDASMRRKPMYHAISAAFRRAPSQ